MKSNKYRTILRYCVYSFVFIFSNLVYADQVCTSWYWVTTYSDGSKSYDYIGTFCEYRDSASNATEATAGGEVGVAVSDMIEYIETSSGTYLKTQLWGFSGIGANTVLECTSSTATKSTVELGVDINLLNAGLGYEKTLTINSSAKFTTPKEMADYKLEGWLKCGWKRYAVRVTIPGGIIYYRDNEIYGEKFYSYDFAKYTNGERTNAW